MLRNLRISTRMIVGFGLLVSLIAGLSGISVVWSGKAELATLKAQQTSDIALLLKDSLLSVQQGRVMAWSYATIGDDAYIKGRDAAFAQFNKQFADVESRLLSSEGKRLCRDYDDAVVVFEASALRFDALKTAGVATTEPDYVAAVHDIDAAATRYTEANSKAGEFYKSLADQGGAEAQRQLEQSKALATFGGVIAVLVGLAAAWVIGRGIVVPIKAMTIAMGKLAGGDLAVEIPSASNRDEIGDMARAVQVFKDNAACVVRLTREQEEAATRAAAERKTMMHGMADDFEASVMGVVKVVSSSASEMRATAQLMSSKATQASAKATTVASAAEQATCNVQTVASAAEQLSSSIAEISRQVAESARISTTASEEAAHTNMMVVALASAADKIGEVVSLISDIASQTNLLALNATIEAARAGEAGKGFAVVASEVKALANQTARATDEIGSQISTVQHEVGRVVEAIKSIGSTIERVRHISAGISAAVEEQGAATLEIARNVHQTAQGTQEVSGNIEGVMEAATSTGAAAEQVLSSAGDLAHNAEKLRGEVGNFLAKVRSA